MEIKDILSSDCTRCAVPITSKKRALQIISVVASEKLSELNEEDVLNSLLCREKMGSTGIGNGIAIPHGRVEGLSSPLAIVLTCSPGIEFDAIDNQPVDIFFAILVPVEQTEGHLQTLARIAQKLSDKEVTKVIRNCHSDNALYEALV
ncbi:PTS IIA-like nitrogen regulatory protein PtsN [Planctobacterium marinum]|uniref:PTS IIA-like nitrogen regulatory protein PtsN n=1 Tax=Planctobacterium marinum TaxID=1631968 RepID=UPI001E634999|nr:PTS IIA-like nitrogen regulatory protein PtsN [Planctobacterium marinum]MCC2604858.1 PTS IIA-like nitrogen regulatory protein PtsN [Planctobacterium marinum]